MNREQVLRRWEERYGALSNTDRKIFLRRNELAEIIRFTEPDVADAITRSRLLKEILGQLQQSAKPWNNPQDTATTPSRPNRKSTGRSTRSQHTKRQPRINRNAKNVLRPRDGQARLPKDIELHRQIGPTMQYDEDT